MEIKEINETTEVNEPLTDKEHIEVIPVQIKSILEDLKDELKRHRAICASLRVRVAFQDREGESSYIYEYPDYQYQPIHNLDELVKYYQEETQRIQKWVSKLLEEKPSQKYIGEIQIAGDVEKL